MYPAIRREVQTAFSHVQTDVLARARGGVPGSSDRGSEGGRSRLSDAAAYLTGAVLIIGVILLFVLYFYGSFK